MSQLLAAPLWAALPGAALPLIAQAGNPSLGRFLLEGIVPMLLIFGVFYLIWFMPLRKKQKAHDDLLQELKKGDKVITNGGFYGKVGKVEGQVITLELADNVKVRINKNAIAGLDNPAEKGN